MKINREGKGVILASLAVVCSATALLVSGAWFDLLPGWLAGSMSAALAVLWVFIVAFFREPARERTGDPDLVYAPCDGKVVVCEPVEEVEFLQGRLLQISVFMSITNVHINWYPVAGEVVYTKYHPGRFMVAWHPKSSIDNERTTTVVDTGRCRVLFRQIAGLVARRIVTYARVGERVEQNDKCGFIKFGSRVDVLLPLDAEPLVRIGENVVGSQTPLARLK